MAKFTKNIERMIADLRHDEKIQAMHRDNIDHAVARRARRAELCRLFLAAYCYRKNAGPVIGYDDREAKKAAIRDGINQKFNGSGMIARVHYLARGREAVEKDAEFTDLYSEVCDELDDQYFKDIDARINNLLGHDKQPNDREAKKAAIRSGIVNKFGGDVGKAIRFYSAVGKEDNQEFNSLFYEVVKELQEEQENDLHKWCENKAEKLARLTGEDKAAIVDRLEGRTSGQENKRPTLSLNRTVSKRENKIITVGNKKAYQVGKGDYKHRNGVIIDN